MGNASNFYSYKPYAGAQMTSMYKWHLKVFCRIFKNICPIHCSHTE